MIALAVYFNCFVGLEVVGRTPRVKIPLAVANAMLGMVPLVCESARTFADATQRFFPFLMLCWQAAFVFEWAATGNGFLVWFWGPGFLVCIFLLTFRRQFFLVGFPFVFFVGLVAEVPSLCALDAKHASQFYFEYDTYAGCVLRGYYQIAVLFASLGGFFVFLAVQKIANYVSALRAATTSRDAHRHSLSLPLSLSPSLPLSLSPSLPLSLSPSLPLPLSLLLSIMPPPPLSHSRSLSLSL
jgi:hypothetical protein